LRAMRIDIFPADMIDIFVVRLSTPDGTVQDDTEAVAAQVEAIIAALPEEELTDIVTHVGGHFNEYGNYSQQGTQYAAMSVYLTPQNTRERRTREVIDGLREPVSQVPGLETVEFEMLAGGPPVGRPLEVKIVGRAFEELQAIAAEVQAFLETQPGVLDITDDFSPGKEEAHVRVDTLEAARLGLDVTAVAQAVSAAFRGVESTEVREGQDELVVRVRLAEPYRNRTETIDQIEVRNHAGRLIPLAQVVDVQQQRGLPTIYHYMGDRVITVSADVDTRVTSSVEVNRALMKAFGDVPQQRPGYRLILTGEWEETEKLIRFIWVAFSIAILVIFSILVIQFNSLGQPFVVIVSIPLGLIGVTLALIAHGQPISVMALMGMVGLGGVAVNDAIVLVNFINHRRRGGMDIHQAVHEAGTARLRPILLTTVTTMTGLLPVIYGWGGYEPFIAPAAITLGYGLLVASALTLFVVPSLYYVAYDIRHKARRNR
jgi:multidrug efflux pump subunit AcrB